MTIHRASLYFFLFHHQVVVLQAYKNDSKKAIEAKYVFPLDDTAAVCGFEAFINNKHIIGIVEVGLIEGEWVWFEERSTCDAKLKSQL